MNFRFKNFVVQCRQRSKQTAFYCFVVSEGSVCMLLVKDAVSPHRHCYKSTQYTADVQCLYTEATLYSTRQPDIGIHKWHVDKRYYLCDKLASNRNVTCNLLRRNKTAAAATARSRIKSLLFSVDRCNTCTSFSKAIVELIPVVHLRVINVRHSLVSTNMLRV